MPFHRVRLELQVRCKATRLPAEQVTAICALASTTLTQLWTGAPGQRMAHTCCSRTRYASDFGECCIRPHYGRAFVTHGTSGRSRSHSFTLSRSVLDKRGSRTCVTFAQRAFLESQIWVQTETTGQQPIKVSEELN